MKDTLSGTVVKPTTKFGKLAVALWNVFHMLSLNLERGLDSFDPSPAIFEKFQGRMSKAAENAAPNRKITKKPT